MSFCIGKLTRPGNGALPGVVLRVDRELIKGSEPILLDGCFLLRLGRTVFLGPWEERRIVLPISVHGTGLMGLFSCCFLKGILVSHSFGKGGTVGILIKSISNKVLTLSPKTKVIKGTFNGSCCLANNPTLIAIVSVFSDLPRRL